jgi:Protein of unknown function (DUF3768)
MDDGDRATKIASLNDEARKGKGGKLFLTKGIDALPAETKADISHQMRNFSDFNEENDPWKEHDFGSFTVGGNLIFWKIEYYDKEAWEKGEEVLSRDPCDPEKTLRMIAVMLADEY